MKRLAMVGLVAALFVTGAMLSAHENFRIIGTVAKVTATTLDVKQAKDGKVISMDIDKDTSVSRDNKTVDRAELKVGASVVVDARGDSIDELLANSVRLVPAPTKK